MAPRSKKPDSRTVAAAGAVATSAATAVAARSRAQRRKRARQFRLNDGEPVADGVRRIARAQLDLVAEQLSRSGDGSADEAVHEVRKAFKRLRALVRLTRDELGPDVRRHENAAFREAGQRLSDVRDARVLLATFDDLVEPGTFAGLRHELHASATRVAAREYADDIAAILDTVAAARERVANWPLGDDATASLASGLKRIHRRARRAHAAADTDPSSANLHELRKRTKDLRHAAQILRAAAPKRMRAVDRDAHDLSDVLGADHDLAMLLDVSRRYPAALTPGDRDLFERLVERRRADLRRDALRRAHKLYATRPRKLARLIG